MLRLSKNLLLFLGLAAFLSSCQKIVGSGPAVSEIKNYTGFSGVSLSIDADVSIVQDSIYSVELIAQQNILDAMRTRLDGNTICFGLEPHAWIKPTEPILIKVHMPILKKLDVSGSGSITTTGVWSAETLQMNVSGSGKINFSTLNAQSVDANISGSGEVAVSDGNATTVETQVSGSGEITMLNVEAENVKTHTSGSGNTRVHAKETLEAHISGSGNVYYKGNPVIESHISGSGKLIHVN